MNYAQVKKEDFSKSRPDMEFTIFQTLEEQNDYFASYMVDQIEKTAAQGQNFVVVFPTGPIDYLPFVQLVNSHNLSLKNLHVFMMDEYCKDENALIDPDHPMSFQGFINNLFLEQVKEELRFPAGQLHFPNPAEPETFTKAIEELGGIDVVFGGLGLSGHLAFNDPPDEEELCTVDLVKNSVTRVVHLTRETIAQNALAGTRGLLEAVPPLAVTIGMKEMLAAKEIHMYLLRKWHSGILRKCLFGPVTPKVPGSFLQEHSNVKIFMPEYVAELPGMNVTLDI